MALSMGIIGLPNVGKSTTFNALTRAQNAQAANYPFCTIEPNKAIVAVPDKRLEALAAIVKPKRIQNSTIEFVDIAGLVKGASKGEGLGNKFLANIRETAAVLHVVRCFDNDDIVHVAAHPDPKTDIEVIEIELIFSDLEQLERKIERMGKLARTDKKLAITLEMATALKGHFEQYKPAISFAWPDELLKNEFFNEMRFITAKKVIFLANVDEDGLAQDNEYVKQLHELAAERNCEVVKVCARLEEEMVGMEEAERQEFLESMGVEESGLEQVIHKSFKALGLMAYFTAGVQEVRAWTIEQGWTAPQAAGVIHTDFERGFIRAEVISYDNFIKYNGESGARNAGVLEVKGKTYVMNDGDVVHFLFNV
ncbi:MAG: redox-regulated ATPase YchF [Sedimentisphaerales bacterium]|nr:redox-regulated ATPase YchF [Sedimentisphaerales bacterium]